MTVKALRGFAANYYDNLALDIMRQFRRRKVGFSLVYSDHGSMVTTILCDAVLEANEPLQEFENVRLPVWLSKEGFDALIYKISAK